MKQLNTQLKPQEQLKLLSLAIQEFDRQVQNIAKMEEKKKEILIIREIGYGIPFIYSLHLDSKTSYIKVKPISFLLNSNIVIDVLNRGDCFVVNLDTGTLMARQGDTEIRIIEKEKE